MSGRIEILRAGPLATVQDRGRPGYLSSGISASGPMDRNAFARAGQGLGSESGIEFTTAGISFRISGAKLKAGFSGGDFKLTINKKTAAWNSAHALKNGDEINITPGPSGNYGYVRFAAEIDVPLVLGSRSTNSVVQLGGYEGRALKAGDRLELTTPAENAAPSAEMEMPDAQSGEFRFVWGLHAEAFQPGARGAFVSGEFGVSAQLDRMGVRLADDNRIFADTQVLSLVSDAIVPGDIQILGDGTPIVLMRDHQPTGGYPRIGTIVSVDLDRFAQLRPGTQVKFVPVTVEHAQQLLRRQRRQA